MPIFSLRKDLRPTRSWDIFIDLRARIIAAPRLAVAEQEKWIFKRSDNWLWYPQYVLRPFHFTFSVIIRDELIANIILIARTCWSVGIKDSNKSGNYLSLDECHVNLKRRGGSIHGIGGSLKFLELLDSPRFVGDKFQRGLVIILVIRRIERAIPLRNFIRRNPIARARNRSLQTHLCFPRKVHSSAIALHYIRSSFVI